MVRPTGNYGFRRNISITFLHFARRAVRLAFSTSLDRWRKRDSAAKANTTISRMQISDMELMAKSLPKKMPENTRQNTFSARIPHFIRLKGELIFPRIMKPTTASSKVEAVAIYYFGRENAWPQITKAPTATTSVSPAGRALSRTFRMKCP